MSDSFKGKSSDKSQMKTVSSSIQCRPLVINHRCEITELPLVSRTCPERGMIPEEMQMNQNTQGGQQNQQGNQGQGGQQGGQGGQQNPGQQSQKPGQGGQQGGQNQGGQGGQQSQNK